MSTLQNAAKNVISVARFTGCNGKEFVIPFECIDTVAFMRAVQDLVAACDETEIEDPAAMQFLKSAKFWLAQKDSKELVVADEEINEYLKLIGFDLAGRLIKNYA
jgi:hypothetical protein